MNESEKNLLRLQIKMRDELTKIIGWKLVQIAREEGVIFAAD